MPGKETIRGMGTMERRRIHNGCEHERSSMGGVKNMPTVGGEFELLVISMGIKRKTISRKVINE